MPRSPAPPYHLCRALSRPSVPTLGSSAARQRCFEGVSILINNAGLARGKALVGEGALGDWREMMDTNCMG